LPSVNVHPRKVWLSHYSPAAISTGEAESLARNYLPFAARLLAFNGLIAVPSPLNPRRSLGGFFALLITT
jgi:hypothetical protein